MAGRNAHKLHRLWKVEVDKLATGRADGVIVAGGLAVETARPVAEGDLVDQSRIFQIPERVINRRVADRRQKLSRRFVDFARRQMILARAHYLKDDAPLTRERRHGAQSTAF